MKQLNLFELTENVDKKELIIILKNKLENYEIDDIYEKNFLVGTYTFTEIKTKLEKNKKYKMYIKELFEELRKYVFVTKNAYNMLSSEMYLIEQREDCIILVTQNCVGPIFCIKMIENRFKEAKYEQV